MSETHTPRDLLVYRGQIDTLEPSLPLPLCPYRLNTVLVERGSNRVVPARCRSHRCPVCLQINASLVGAAIALSRPTMSLLLTRAGDEWSSIRESMKRLRQSLSLRGLAGEWVWHVEPNPSSNGQHVHVWQRGADDLDESVLCLLAQRAGFGAFATVQPIKTEPVGWVDGRLHGAGAMTYGMKLTRIDVRAGRRHLLAQQRSFLTANGGRLQHSSRGFWRDATGARVTGVEGAISALQGLRRSGRLERWDLMLRTSAASVLAFPTRAA